MASRVPNNPHVIPKPIPTSTNYRMQYLKLTLIHINRHPVTQANRSSSHNIHFMRKAETSFIQSTVSSISQAETTRLTSSFSQIPSALKKVIQYFAHVKQCRRAPQDWDMPAMAKNLVIALPVPPSHQSTNTIPERSPTGMRN
jgi:hypothetical protein